MRVSSGQIHKVLLNGDGGGMRTLPEVFKPGQDQRNAVVLESLLEITGESWLVWFSELGIILQT